MRKLVFAGFAALLLAGGPVPSPAVGLDQGNLGEMNPKHTHIQKTFPVLAGQYPNSTGRGAYPFVTYNSYGCASVTYCDRLVFNIQYPKGYIESFRGTKYVSFGVRVKLTWANPKDDNLDLFVWAIDDPSSGSPQGVCSVPGSKDCLTLYPEAYDVVEATKDVDDPSTKEDESSKPIPIYVSVVNTTGVNTGYTIDLQWFLIKLGDLPKFTLPKIGGASSQQSHPITASETPAPFFKGSGNAGGRELPKILVPGADGKLTEQSLNFVAAGNRLKPTHSGTASWVWISALVVAGIALLVFAFFVVQRRRQEARF